MLLLIALLLGIVCAYANPTPGPIGQDTGVSIMQTLEFTYHAEFPISESKSSVILYGGPTAAFIWYPEDERGEGLGLEAGVELRGYKGQMYSGAFAGAYAGGGILWRREEENTEAFSAGLKFGWRKDLHGMGVPFDLEPYLCAGFMVDPYSADNWLFRPAPVFYLGLKLAFF